MIGILIAGLNKAVNSKLKIGRLIMSDISINALSGVSGTSSQSANVNNETTAVEVKEVVSDEAVDVIQVGETIQLSSRAQNIQKLNDEFFSEGFSNFKVSNEFIDRLSEYGLISISQADNLSLSVFQDETEQESSELGMLFDDVIGLMDRLIEQNADPELIGSLEQSLDIFTRLDDNANKPTANEIADIRGSLTFQQNADSAQNLSQFDQATLEQLNLTLSIAQKLNPSAMTASAINQYLTTTS